MADFWPSCGYGLLDHTADGRLRITDEFLRSHLARRELAPAAQSCVAELHLHRRLMSSPRETVGEADVAALADPDTRENYRVWLRFRSRLIAAPTLESAYLRLFLGGDIDVPPLLVREITQILLRHILGEGASPLEARAAELLFRTQKITVQDNVVIAADEETIERYATTGAFGNLGELLAQSRVASRTIDLDVLSQENASAYWQRSEQFDFAVSLNHGGAVLDALCRVLERWIEHFLEARVTIKPQRNIDDPRWVWHVGLDADASALLNDLYQRAEVGEERLQRLIALFDLRFADAARVRPEVAGRPVHLAMAMDQKQRLNMKPQNLLVNLPLACSPGESH